MNKDVVNVYRGEVLESSHKIHVTVVDTEGNLKYTLGDPKRRTFPRSALKPFQAIPLIENGAAEIYSFTQEEIALCCASHNGERIHQLKVMDILLRMNEKESVLKCGPYIPKDIDTYKEVLKSGGDITSSFNNCSGKHTGIIAACHNLNEEVENYYQFEHPIQLQISTIISEVCGVTEKDIKLAKDGCGLPTHQFPLQNLALGYARLGSPEQSATQIHVQALSTIKESMMAYPYMVAGKDRFDTDIMKALKGRIVTKMGAEGVQAIGLPKEGLGIAIKVEDGNNRAASVAAMKVLEQLNIIDPNSHPELDIYRQVSLKNTVGEVVGRITADFELEEERDQRVTVAKEEVR